MSFCVRVCFLIKFAVDNYRGLDEFNPYLRVRENL